MFSITSNLWRWRRLLGRLTRREFASRYAGSALGAMWAVLEPLVQFALYFTVFPVFLGMRLEGRPGVAAYGFFLASGLVPFLAFQEAVVRAAGLARSSGALIRHVNVPLEVLATASVAAVFARQGVALVLLTLIAAAVGSLAWANLAWVVVGAVLLLILTLGLALALVPTGAFLPDIGQLIGTATTVLFFLTPVVYQPGVLPAGLREWLPANPLAGILEPFRAAFVGEPVRAVALLSAVAWALAAALFGSWVFSRRACAVRDMV